MRPYDPNCPPDYNSPVAESRWNARLPGGGSSVESLGWRVSYHVRTPADRKRVSNMAGTLYIEQLHPCRRDWEKFESTVIDISVYVGTAFAPRLDLPLSSWPRLPCYSEKNTEDGYFHYKDILEKLKARYLDPETRDPSSALFALTCDMNGTVGFCALRLWRDHYLVVEDFAIHQHFRKMGYASLMFNKLKTWARERRLLGIKANLSSDRIAACELLDKLGFYWGGFHGDTISSTFARLAPATEVALNELDQDDQESKTALWLTRADSRDTGCKKSHGNLLSPFTDHKPRTRSDTAVTLFARRTDLWCYFAIQGF